MAKTSEKMKKLQELRDRQAAEVSDLERKIAEAKVRLGAYDTALATMGGIPLPARGTRATNVKKTVMAIVVAAGPAGITATEVVEKAALNGRQLVAGSVSSLLSRFKRDGALTFDGERYRSASQVSQLPAFKVVS